jgi:serine-type D-Ala-D-Ala carboxypeptidase (penicillin-binding protein 5/6)
MSSGRAGHPIRSRLVVAFVASLVVIAVAAVASHHAPSPARSRTAGGLSADGSSSTAPPPPVLSLTAAARTVVAGALPGMPWPAAGEAAIGVQGSGLIAASQRQPEVPIASVTKVMTALLVLRDHPLAGESGGPSFRMTEQDALDFQHDAESGDSNLMVVAGEVLDERQLLEALLIPSADNIADYLARWDAGSVGAFVARMNTEAQALGMTSTHYADASGLDPASRSTAADQVRLAAVAMSNPVFAGIVRQPTVQLPVSGKVWNYNPIIGTDGVVGVKSGFTDEASGCLVAAAWREVGGRAVLLVSAALGQPLGLYQAGDVDRALLDAATPLLQLRAVITEGTPIAAARVPWSSRATPAAAGAAASVVVWPGAVVELSLHAGAGQPPWAAQNTSRPGSGWVVPAATRLGEVDVSMDGTPVASVPVRLEAPIEGPPAGWSAPSG